MKKLLTSLLVFVLLLSPLAAAYAAGATWTCPDCGTNGLTGKFCENCGSRKPDESWTCPSCGANGLTGKFCPECGAKRSESSKAAAPQSADELLALGLKYYNGDGVAQDKSRAAELFEQAAALGNATAQFNAGYMYDTGDGIATNKTRAAEYYTQAAAQGDLYAQFNLAYMYDNGDGIAQNKARAAEYYTMAAEQGDADAKFLLGKLYSLGEGVAQDEARAIDLFEQSASQGNADAQVTLGYMYENGIGVGKDTGKALDYYKAAMDQGSSVGETYYNELLGSLPTGTLGANVIPFEYRTSDTLEDLISHNTPQIMFFSIGDTYVEVRFNWEFPAGTELRICYYDASGEMQSERCTLTSAGSGFRFSLPGGWKQDDYINVSANMQSDTPIGKLRFDRGNMEFYSASFNWTKFSSERYFGSSVSSMNLNAKDLNDGSPVNAIYITSDTPRDEYYVGWLDLIRETSSETAKLTVYRKGDVDSVQRYVGSSYKDYLSEYNGDDLSFYQTYANNNMPRWMGDGERLLPYYAS